MVSIKFPSHLTEGMKGSVSTKQLMMRLSKMGAIVWGFPGAGEGLLSLSSSSVAASDTCSMMEMMDRPGCSCWIEVCLNEMLPTWPLLARR